MTLVLWMKQSDQGCGYTIGCAEKLVYLKAATVDDAMDEIVGTLEDYGLPTNTEIGIERLVVLKVVTELDVDDVLDEKVPEEEVDDPAKAARREQYERLRKEFEA